MCACVWCGSQPSHLTSSSCRSRNSEWIGFPVVVVVVVALQSYADLRCLFNPSAVRPSALCTQCGCPRCCAITLAHRRARRYISRADMYRFQRGMRDLCVYYSKTVAFEGMRAQVLFFTLLCLAVSCLPVALSRLLALVLTRSLITWDRWIACWSANVRCPVVSSLKKRRSSFDRGENRRKKQSDPEHGNGWRRAAATRATRVQISAPLLDDPAERGDVAVRRGRRAVLREARRLSPDSL